MQYFYKMILIQMKGFIKLSLFICVNEKIKTEYKFGETCNS
jgi:hypothetical protein